MRWSNTFFKKIVPTLSNSLYKKCLVLAQAQKIYINFVKIITTSYFHAIPCDLKSVLSYLSISTLSIVELCDELSDELSATMKEKDIYGQAVSIKIKSHDFKLKTKVIVIYVVLLITAQSSFALESKGSFISLIVVLLSHFNGEVILLWTDI